MTGNIKRVINVKIIRDHSFCIILVTFMMVMKWSYTFHLICLTPFKKINYRYRHLYIYINIYKIYV